MIEEVEILKGLDGDDILSWEEALVPIFDVLDVFARFSGFFDVFVIEILDDIRDVLEPKIEYDWLSNSNYSRVENN